MEHDFIGSKAALFIGDRLLITLRDDDDHIPFPNYWDLVGGGREGRETPFETLQREVREEVGLELLHVHIVWRRRYPSTTAMGYNWFFVAKLPAGAEKGIVFGDEGQGWKLAETEAVLSMSDFVPSFAPRLRDWLLESRGADATMIEKRRSHT